MNQLEEASIVTGEPAPQQLQQWKLSVMEELDNLHTINDEILASIKDDAIEEMKLSSLMCFLNGWSNTYM